jgi:copper chaperone CopZ
MPVTDQPVAYSYVAAPGQSAFPVSCEIFAGYAGAFLVKVNGAAVPYTSLGGAGFFTTLAYADGSEGGDILLGTPCTGGETVEISRALPVERISEMPEAGPISIAALNLELDRIIALIQDSNGSDAGFVASLLASTGGAGLVGYVGSGTGAIYRTVQSKLRDVVNVKDFGAIGNGIADDTAAIQAAINAVSGGGEVSIPAGTFKITDTLSVTGQAVRIRGYGAFASKLEMTALNKPILNATGDHFNFSGFSTHYAGTPVAGGSAIVLSGAHIHGDNFLVRNAFDGVTVTNCSDVRLSSFAVLDYENIGIYCHDSALDVYVSKFYLNCGTTVRGALGGIRLYNRCEACVFTDGEVLKGVYPITFASAAYTAGARPAYSKFANIYFDSAANAAQVNNCVEIDFLSCWFSNRPGSGLAVQTVDGVRFTGGGAINCGSHGVTVAATAVRVVFNGFAARGNGANGANTGDGINVAAARPTS